MEEAKRQHRKVSRLPIYTAKTQATNTNPNLDSRYFVKTLNETKRKEERGESKNTSGGDTEKVLLQKELYEQCMAECGSLAIVKEDSFDHCEYESVFPSISTSFTNFPHQPPLLNPPPNTLELSNVGNAEKMDDLMDVEDDQVDMNEREESKHGSGNIERHELNLLRGEDQICKQMKMRELNNQKVQSKESTIYKSIVKNIGSFLYDNHREIKTLLGRIGYSVEDIDNGINKLTKWVNKNKKSVSSKARKDALEKIIGKHSTQIYIIRRALKMALDAIDNDSFDRKIINTDTYRKVYQECYEKTLYTIRNANF